MSGYKVGDIVTIKCKVLSKGTMAFTQEVILDLVPMCELERKAYTVHTPWSLFESDVMKVVSV
jgi:hypothetical protein